MQLRELSLPILAAALVAGADRAAHAQTAEYTIEILDDVPGANSTIGTGLNDEGMIVGWSQFFGQTPGLVGWTWTHEDGFSILPQPPTLSSSRAIDVNDSGVVAGDGGYDSGVAWRFENGVYELLGTLPGDGISDAAGINELGAVVGTSRAATITIPKKPFLAPDNMTMLAVLGDGYAGYVNDLDQVTGVATPGFTTIEAFRFTPGRGVQLLGPLGGRPYTRGSSINNLGDVVGFATHANGNGSVPFVYTDAAGMQEIGNFGGAASATDINDRGEVVGIYDPSGPSRAWIWTAEQGVRFLSDLTEPAPGFVQLEARRINEAGQVLGYGYDNNVADFRTFLLTPVVAPTGRAPDTLGSAPRAHSPR